ncbi:MAG: hypothetical protein RR319_01305 [Bacteroides sp.]
MKEKILQAIKEKLGKTSLSEKTIAKKAERLAKKITKDEEMTTDVIADAVDDLKDIEGQLNHDVAEQVTTQVAEKLKNTKPGGNNVDVTENENDEIKTALEEVKTLKAELAAEKELKLKESFRKSVVEALEKQGSTDEFYREHVLLKYGLDEKKSVEENATLLKSKYDETVSERGANGGVPHSGNHVPAEVDKTAREAAIKEADKKLNINC